MKQPSLTLAASGVRSPFPRLAAAVLLIVMVGSCDRSDKPKLCSVQGSVSHDGKPVENAMVVFVPSAPSKDGKARRPAGTTGADGRFTLSTYGPMDGAAEGEYRVLVLCPGTEVNGQPGPDRFGGRYADPNKSPLRATVAPGENRLEPFNLK